MDGAELAKFLVGKGHLSDLNGTHVVFTGLGDTAGPQAPLGVAQRKSLQLLWRAVLGAAGAVAEFDEAPLFHPPSDDLPAVPVVALPAPQTVDSTGAAVKVEVPYSALTFVPDGAELVDPRVARETLKPIADQALASGYSVQITGLTASSGSSEQQLSLSTARARSIAELFTELGVPANKISTRGAGQPARAS